MIAHAGLIAAWLRGAWRGVLIEGPSGAGKSDLTLRALGQGFWLVADDRVSLWTSDGRLFGRAPDALFGLLEVRGLQVIQVPALRLAEVALVARYGAPERIPEARSVDLLGVSVPLIELDLSQDSAAAKLSRALDHFDAAHKRRI
ncbi:HPr kinase/phosphatase C-terminal domain-containing protein [Phenylobacterium sp.]|uniref:HPr kinase/phosphorylase n=1 Tax=Phenylobacterium sp. TaxID=1871053 RepID=UPI00120986AC|nr:HPr kinase/phosphatase C-terminal domain-containing protein [Phenylobacterium sp.]THD51519.1 MAG: HPr kinase/phosphorylase [Phenylobacterium sp.]